MIIMDGNGYTFVHLTQEDRDYLNSQPEGNICYGGYEPEMYTKKEFKVLTRKYAEHLKAVNESECLSDTFIFVMRLNETEIAN